MYQLEHLFYSIFKIHAPFTRSLCFSVQSELYNPHLGKDGLPEEPVMNKCIWSQEQVPQMLSDFMLKYGFVSFIKQTPKVLEMLTLSILIILISLFNIFVLEFDQ